MPDHDLELELPSTSGFIRGFQLGDDPNYDMSIMLDIDEFSDFQLLSPTNKEEYDVGQDDANDTEQFSIIDATGMLKLYSQMLLKLHSFISFLDLQFFSENTNIIHLVSNGSKWSVFVIMTFRTNFSFYYR